MSTEKIQLSAQERRLLRNVFYRHAAPYLAIMGLISIIAITRAHSDDTGQDESAVVAAASPMDVEALHRDQKEARALIADLAKTSQAQQADVVAVTRQLAALEKRLASTSRLAKEAENATRKALAAAETASKTTSHEAADWGVSSILERLYNVEVRQDRVEASSGKRGAESTGSMRVILDRLGALEERTSRVEGLALVSGATEMDSVPASPAAAPGASHSAPPNDP